MAELLDPSEVDALMAAVDESGPSSDPDSAAGQIFSRRGDLALDSEIREYDFKRPERVSKEQMRALETLHEAFARNFGAGLSGFLRTIVEVKVASIEQLTFFEFTHSLPTPTCFNLLGCDPLEGNMCLEISPLIIYPIIDRLLGGSSADLFIPQRPLTAIEQRLVNQVLDRAMTGLHDAWENICGINFSLQEAESNPALVQIVAPNEVVVAVNFEIKMGNRAGTMAMCVPYNVIEPVVDRLSNQSWANFKQNKKQNDMRRRLAGHLESAPIEITAVLADTTISLRDLKSLEIGDLILTDKPASAPLSLEIEDKRKFIGHLGQYKGNRAFKVDRSINAKDRV